MTHAPTGHANRANWRGVRFLVCPDCKRRGVYLRHSVSALWWCRLCRWDVDLPRVQAANPGEGVS